MSEMVDKNGMRFGAGLSGAVLVLAFSVDAQIVIPIIAVALGMGSVFGPSRTPMAWIFRALRGSAFKNMKPDPEPVAPPRFAQTLGFVFLAAASLALVGGAVGLAWTLALLVSVLQALLATTGICVGCEMYILIKRLGARGA